MSDLEQWEFIVAEAVLMGAKEEAIRKWRERGRVPHRWRLSLLNAAKAKKKKLDDAIFDNIPQATDSNRSTVAAE